MMLKRTLDGVKKVARLMRGATWRLDKDRIRTGSCERDRLRCPITWAALAAGRGDFRLGSYVEAAASLGIRRVDAILISLAADNLKTPPQVRVVLLEGMS